MRDLKLVLRTYSNIRRMTSDDLALLETLRAMTDTEREMTVETLQDKPATKKASKKSSKPATKSERASGMAAQLNKNLKQQREMTKDDDYQGFAAACAHEWTTGSGRLTICTMPADANVHHLKTHPDYHEFVEGKSTAPPAPALSPVNGRVASESESVSAVNGD